MNGFDDSNLIVVINDEPRHSIAFRMNKPTNGVVTVHQSEALRTSTAFAMRSDHHVSS